MGAGAWRLNGWKTHTGHVAEPLQPQFPLWETLVRRSLGIQLWGRQQKTRTHIMSHRQTHSTYMNTHTHACEHVNTHTVCGRLAPAVLRPEHRQRGGSPGWGGRAQEGGAAARTRPAVGVCACLCPQLLWEHRALSCRLPAPGVHQPHPRRLRAAGEGSTPNAQGERPSVPPCVRDRPPWVPTFRGVCPSPPPEPRPELRAQVLTAGEKPPAPLTRSANLRQCISHKYAFSQEKTHPSPTSEFLLIGFTLGGLNTSWVGPPAPGGMRGLPSPSNTRWKMLEGSPFPTSATVLSLKINGFALHFLLENSEFMTCLVSVAKGLDGIRMFAPRCACDPASEPGSRGPAPTLSGTGQSTGAELVLDGRVCMSLNSDAEASPLLRQGGLGS